MVLRRSNNNDNFHITGPVEQRWLKMLSCGGTVVAETELHCHSGPPHTNAPGQNIDSFIADSESKNCLHPKNIFPDDGNSDLNRNLECVPIGCSEQDRYLVNNLAHNVPQNSQNQDSTVTSLSNSLSRNSSNSPNNFKELGKNIPSNLKENVLTQDSKLNVNESNGTVGNISSQSPVLSGLDSSDGVVIERNSLPGGADLRNKLLQSHPCPPHPCPPHHKGMEFLNEATEDLCIDVSSPALSKDSNLSVPAEAMVID